MCLPKKKTKEELEEEERRNQEEHVGSNTQETEISTLETMANQLRTVSYRETVIVKDYEEEIMIVLHHQSLMKIKRKQKIKRKMKNVINLLIKSKIFSQ